MEALKTGLMGFFQKRKFRNFLQYVAAFNAEDSSTWDGFDAARLPMQQLFEKYGLDENTQEFTGHAMALEIDDSYKTKPALETLKQIQLYASSLDRYGQSPFIYPIYGLGGLPEGFSRLSAIHGGTFMLNKNVDEIVYDEGGDAVGILSKDEETGEMQAASAPILIGDPSYFPTEKCKVTGQVVRCICILDHPVAAVEDNTSAQIIIPQHQVGRLHDIYVSIVSYAHLVAGRDKYIAIASTTVETKDPHSELAPALALLGPTLKTYFNVQDTYDPVADGTTDRCFISSSYDATSHFETTTADVLSLYERVTGKKLVTRTPEGAEEA
jgi:Rab GDP dissociation inhibitor